MSDGSGSNGRSGSPGVGRVSGAGRRSLALVLAIAAGVSIAFVDSRPNWDDTTITAGLLFLGAGLAAAVGRDRPWVWALVVGLPTPIIETVQDGALGSWLAIIFAFAGAYAGWAFARAGR